MLLATGGALGAAGRAAVVLLPWLALVGLPRSRTAAPRPLRSASLDLGMALPPLCVAARLDVARGVPAAELALVASCALALLFLWSLAAERARRGERRRSLFGLAWLCAVPGAAALHCALLWAAQPGEGTSWVAAATVTTPLVWCHRWASAGAPPLAASLAGLALAVAVGFFAYLGDGSGRNGTLREGAAGPGESR